MLGEFTTGAIVFLLGAVTFILLYLIYIWFRNPVIAKLGLRNLARRPAQTVLIIIGLTLSTVIIISALGTGDTLRYSVQRQAVAAYGKVDEIIAPPLLSMLVSMANPNGNSEQAAAAQSTMNELMKGGLDSVLALVQGGLPSISTERLERLRAASSKEPLIDGVSGALVFPTIIRNVETGQNEPLGFIYAVDDQYPEAFGLKSVNGQPLSMEKLEPGIGNIFLQAAKLFAVVPTLAQKMNELQTDAAANGITSDALVGPLPEALAAIGALLTGVNPDALPNITISLDTLDQLGVNTAPLRALGKDTISLKELAQLIQTVAPTETISGTLPIAGATITNTALLSATAEMLATSEITTTGITTAAMGALSGVSGDLMKAINLNTIGYELDRTLAPYGLQLRQGDLYLNRLGAQKLGANVGDVLELYIGPLPVRFRVRAVVDEAGPISSLLPVVMLRLDEAQKLLFMDGKVNAVLVSNLGDELSGMQHTDAVSKRLAILALDDEAVRSVAEIVSQPEVNRQLRDLAANLPDSPTVTVDDEADMPPMLAGIFNTLMQTFNLQQMSKQEANLLLDAVDKGDDDRLRSALARSSVREWLATAPLTPELSRKLSTAVASLNQFEQIEPLNKTTIVTAANVGGGIFSSIFSIFGIFSILAGLLLIVLIVVMLAAERRVEIGVARAVGVQRSQVVQMFMVEGMVYNLLAAALGVLLGIGITFTMTAFIGRLFNDVTGQISEQAGGVFTVGFAISWQSMVIAYCLGVLITWLAMTITTSRASRMNIVTAIRDLPDEAEAKRRSRLAQIWSWIYPILVAGLGIYILTIAIDTHSMSLVLIATTLMLYGAAVLIGRILELTPLRNETGYRIVYTLLGAGLILIWVLPWYKWAPQLYPDLFTWDPTQAPTVFTIGGPLIIIGAIMVIMFNAGFLSSLIAGILGFITALRPVLKTAVAYPLSARFRTGMTMVLFAMIMATVVVMAVVINTTQSLIKLDPQATAGFEMRVEPTLLSFFNPISDIGAAIAAQANAPQLAQVESVGRLTDQLMTARVAGTNHTGRTIAMTGVNQGFVDQASKIYSFQARAPGFESDAAIWEALMSRDDVVVVKPRVMTAPVLPFGMQAPSDAELNTMPVEDDEESFGPPGDRPRGPNRVFGRFTLDSVKMSNGKLPEVSLELTTDGQDGVTRVVTAQVIGVLSDDTNLAEGNMLASEATLSRLRSVPVTGDATYVKVKDGADAKAVAAGIEGAFVSTALNTSLLADEYAQRQRLTGGALQLLQGFMALGLLVGIAALGVISTRAVIERRQQVGMLRAMGYQKGMVALSFLLEASFISITGLLIGAVTGVVLGNNMISAFFPQIDRSVVSIPWTQIGLIVLAAYLFSLLTTILPAWQASRIYPAEALRYE